MGGEETWERQRIKEAFELKSDQIAAFLETEIGKKIKENIWQRQIPEGDNLRIIGPGSDTELTVAAKQLERFSDLECKLTWLDIGNKVCNSRYCLAMYETGSSMAEKCTTQKVRMPNYCRNSTLCS